MRTVKVSTALALWSASISWHTRSNRYACARSMLCCVPFGCRSKFAMHLYTTGWLVTSRPVGPLMGSPLGVGSRRTCRLFSSPATSASLSVSRFRLRRHPTYSRSSETTAAMSYLRVSAKRHSRLRSFASLASIVAISACMASIAATCSGERSRQWARGLLRLPPSLAKAPMLSASPAAGDTRSPNAGRLLGTVGGGRACCASKLVRVLLAMSPSLVALASWSKLFRAAVGAMVSPSFA
mmetsp:Transcript_5071/g.10386  ORF Transcript_5071/g.10386 Transcript_5071/m.10386 type:complete len:239 (+) Transcript_5071:260-976(+)